LNQDQILLIRGKSNFLIYSISPLFLLFFWEVGVHLSWINATYFPAPSEICAQLINLLSTDQIFWNDIWSSIYRLILGALISVFPAIILGIAVVLNKTVDYIFKPLIALTYPVPKLAIFPLLLVFFGIGDASKIKTI